MGESKVFNYIKKLIPLILVVCILATVAVNIALQKDRTYTASLVIDYTYDVAEDGKSPLGDDLDVNEIKSSVIMTRVIDELELSGDYSVDDLTSRINIVEVPDPDKQAAKEGAQKQGEDFFYFPTTYIVEFTAKNSEGEDFARKVLDATIDNYFQVFGENYVNVAHISNKLEKIYDDNYDYIDMVEYIDQYIDETVGLLYNRDSVSPYYRSTETGRSFDDLVESFNYIQSTKISDLFARILEYQVTKSKAVLNTTYKARIDNNDITSTTKKILVDNVEIIIENYLDKMQESGNTDMTYQYILNEVYEKDTVDVTGEKIDVDQTVTYDELIYAWRDDNADDRLAIIDTAYCNYILDAFNECHDTCGDTCTHSTKTCTAISNANYSQIEKDISDDINKVVDQLAVLYDLAVKTCDEYNQYLGCQYISVLSTSSTAVSVNVELYTVLAFIFFMVICCGGAILIGRMNDIVLKSFYTDQVSGFRNRSYFDKYLAKRGRNKLDDGTVVVSMLVTNQHDINQEYGRETGDEVVKLFADELRFAFANMSAMFVHNGKSHFIVIIENTEATIVDEALGIFYLAIDGRDKCEKFELKYKVGLAESFRDQLSSTRKLLTEAIKNYEDKVSMPHKEEDDEID